MKPKVKYNIFIYLVTSLLVSSCYGLGTLDLSELNSVQYNVQILDTPVSETEIPMNLESETPAPPTMTMVNKEGQKYRCYLPLVPETDEKEDKTVEEAVPDIAKLLSPLEDGICMYKTKDWWTYEVCYKGSVRYKILISSLILTINMVFSFRFYFLEEYKKVIFLQTISC